MRVIVDTALYKKKEELYVNVRAAEGRIISNDSLRQLPFVDDDHPYKTEWDIRAKNFSELAKYFDNKSTRSGLNILDIGCGNGWMTNRLNEKGHIVIGIDLNITELKQAEEVFGENEKLQWVYADILNYDTAMHFDIILFSASCQYFPNIELLTHKLLPLLKENGEIHFHDSVFYDAAKLEGAKKRSRNYYAQLGFPEMAGYYFHHAVSTIKKLNYHSMYPRGFFAKKQPLGWWMKKK